MFNLKALTLKRALKSSILALALAGVTQIAGASLFDVNFYSTGFGGSAATGAAATGTAGDTWNGIAGDSGSGGPSNLVNSSGASISATISYDTFGGGAVIPVADNIQPNPSLMEDYLYNSTGDGISVTLQNLAPDTAYDLYVYVASGDGGDGSRAATVTANSVSASASGIPQTSFIAGQNYVLLQTTSDGSGTIDLTEVPEAGVSSSPEVDMNGLQIQTAPEPATLAIGATMLLTLAAANRLRKRPTA